MFSYIAIVKEIIGTVAAGHHAINQAGISHFRVSYVTEASVLEVLFETVVKHANRGLIPDGHFQFLESGTCSAIVFPLGIHDRDDRVDALDRGRMEGSANDIVWPLVSLWAYFPCLIKGQTINNIWPCQLLVDL